MHVTVYEKNNLLVNYKIKFEPREKQIELEYLYLLFTQI